MITGGNGIKSERDRGEALVMALSSERGFIREIAHSQGGEASFPVEVIDMFRRLGVLTAPLPRVDGGLGWGTEDAGTATLCAAFKVLGQGSLSVGRIYEAHVNAIALIFQYGHSTLRAEVADAVRDGQLLGLWVAPASEPVRVSRRGSQCRVTGTKPFCTAAGFAKRAVITAVDDDDQERMIFVDTSDATLRPDTVHGLHGMRHTSTLAVDFDCDVPIEHAFGAPGDYVREPDFSTGAWRTSAITVGGLQALVDETIRQLRTRNRHDNPHQAARIGQMLIKLHTADAWVDHAAERSRHRNDPRALTAFVNLARVAVEQACLEVIPLVQRSLGLAGLMQANPVEAMMRDIATYLRQPAGDEALCEAATTFAETSSPSSFGIGR